VRPATLCAVKIQPNKQNQHKVKKNNYPSLKKQTIWQHTENHHPPGQKDG